MYKFPGSVHSKLPKVGTTIFTVMSKLAVDQGAINLSQGFPDFPVSPHLVDLVYKHMREGRNQYPPMAGIPRLREVISAKQESLYSAQYDPETEVTITAGGTQAIFTAIQATIGEGDEVILFTPAYDCYAPAIELVGGKPVYVQLNSDDYSIDWRQVKKLISRHTKMIMLNTPHNPTGATLTSKDMKELIKITKGSDIIILSDEVYEHIIFDGQEHQSVSRYKELAERSFVVYSFGKTFHVTGWKTGYVLAPSNLMAEFRKVHQFNVFTANAPIQYALAEYMINSDNYMSVAAEYQRKRDVFLSAVEGSRFKVKPSKGTYFQLLDYSTISDEADTELAKRLTIEHKIASIPVSVFYHNPVQNNVLRFCFAKEEETLLRAGEIISSI
ncbi:MAG: methionine aminotransferase [Flavobacteriales bacterium]|jgi:methionine aminotransferase|nr:methionine aminotransferase [Flavobacteriales bacterium]MBT3962654.1 methionine aminotransferase [Flavobacteriales bacterium]MBT4705817.1 methionine aminotransferase [Flavobacteriales bacterium]MBT4931619.1 methionine aminotransferase [Flavobacteriales bacterium]MBT6132356.1 methionine aminotransferase [Flavobacteriales bacterium]